MTDDEQEALSCRYVMPRVMRLASGRFALFTGRGLDFLAIYDTPEALASALPSYDDLEGANRPEPRRPTGRITALNLADLGL